MSKSVDVFGDYMSLSVCTEDLSDLPSLCTTLDSALWVCGQECVDIPGVAGSILCELHSLSFVEIHLVWPNGKSVVTQWQGSSTMTPRILVGLAGRVCDPLPLPSPVEPDSFLSLLRFARQPIRGSYEAICLSIEMAAKTRSIARPDSRWIYPQYLVSGPNHEVLTDPSDPNNALHCFSRR